MRSSCQNLFAVAFSILAGVGVRDASGAPIAAHEVAASRKESGALRVPQAEVVEAWQTNLAPRNLHSQERLSVETPESEEHAESDDLSLLQVQPVIFAKTGVAGDPGQRSGNNKWASRSGSAIWDETARWATIREWHPEGVVSNTNVQGVVLWAEVPHMSLNGLLLLSVVAFPALLVAVFLLSAVMVSMCLSSRRVDTTPMLPSPRACMPDGPAEDSREASGLRADDVVSPPALRPEDLTPFSRALYTIWANFCCTIPSQFVFGVPLVLLCISRCYPAEVFSILTLVTAAAVFSNGVYMAMFSGATVMRMRRCMFTDYREMLKGPREPQVAPPSEREIGTVMHWVILPQYTEDVEIVSMTLESLCAGASSRQNVGVVLAMEEREPDAHTKVRALTERFSGSLREILATYHPSNLPNDPPGKASNTAWAFRELVAHLRRQGRDMTNVVLTVADADSDFHEGYFEGVAQLYLETEPGKRDRRIWQSPVFHLKNYHRQPAPVIVGAMFTTMAEMAALSDPNAVRFPYSTYSLSLSLARDVGGWDPEWIAEDWHMGIKCFLLTLGQTTVEPILLPTLNYTPEDTTWQGTMQARWSQAKRHSLGFSDFSYYFMMLPLIFAHCRRNDTPQSVSDFWRMLFTGCGILSRLMNVHVIVGVLTTYSMLALALKLTMFMLMQEDLHIETLFVRTNFCVYALFSTSSVCMLVVCASFQSVYETAKHRIETPKEGPGLIFQSTTVHYLYTLVCFLLFATVYFFALAVTFWKAAWNVLTTKTHKYEVASKLTMEQVRAK